ncbi:MAG: iron-containing alcohol dehydrogenase [Alkalispirochaeta sp.]
MKPFTIPKQPVLSVEAGAIRRLPDAIARWGYRSVAMVTGGRSVRSRDIWATITDGLLDEGIDFLDFTVRGEPSPDLVDRCRDEVVRELPRCEAVVAIGGGSVIDASKALAALLGMERESSSGSDATRDGTSLSIADYLEGVGTRTPSGATLPCIAVPTTAGTGSEATKNAVLSSIGPEGYKKSLRHDNFVPVRAILDAELHTGAPDEVTRASGLDAITQLIEVYLSRDANPVTDALALTGIQHAGRAFPALLDGEDSVELRAEMALAAYLSGVGLAAAGLGVVHGIASPVGALREIPHGVFCGLTLAPSIEQTVEVGRDGSDDARSRYALVAAAIGLSDVDHPAGAVEQLVETLRIWADPLPRLGAYGFTPDELLRIARESGVKNHPVSLSAEDIHAILEAVR